MLMTNETRAELGRLSGSVGELRLVCNALRERIEMVERRLDDKGQEPPQTERLITIRPKAVFG